MNEHDYGTTLSMEQRRKRMQRENFDAICFKLARIAAILVLLAHVGGFLFWINK